MRIGIFTINNGFSMGECGLIELETIYVFIDVAASQGLSSEE